MPDPTTGSERPLTAEEFLRLARGDDPIRPAIWNGPPHITTPPEKPMRPMADEGQMFEFLLPYPIHIFDSAEWPPLRIERSGVVHHLLKPLSMNVTAKEQVAAGNESPDLFCSNIRAIILKTSVGFPTKHATVFEIVKHALQWMRTLSRQYWIGTGTAGVAAAYRGSAFRVEGAVVRQMNYASYGHAAVVRAFPFEFWEPLGKLVEQNVPVPVSESIFCDGLSGFAAGDTVRCAVELGVAVEIELSNLLDDLATLRATTTGARKYMKERRKLSFERRFLDGSVWVGAIDPKTFTIPKRATDWTDQIMTLYKLRNKCAHQGRAVIPDGSGGLRPLTAGELQGFIFSVESFYRWSSDQRSRAGLPNPSGVLDRSHQISAIVGDPLTGGGFVTDTSESEASSSAGAAAGA